MVRTRSAALRSADRSCRARNVSLPISPACSRAAICGAIGAPTTAFVPAEATSSSGRKAARSRAAATGERQMLPSQTQSTRKGRPAAAPSLITSSTGSPSGVLDLLLGVLRQPAARPPRRSGGLRLSAAALHVGVAVLVRAEVVRRDLVQHDPGDVHAGRAEGLERTLQLRAVQPVGADHHESGP